jgi:hypothetical protein
MPPLTAGQEILSPGIRQAFYVDTFRPELQIPSVTGDVIIRVQNESGANPSQYIEATITAGQQIGTRASGRVDFVADGIIYIRVIQTDGVADGIQIPLEVVGVEYLGLDGFTSLSLVVSFRQACMTRA